MTTITQIIPATGWCALYTSPKACRETKEPSLYTQSLVCWALIQGEDGDSEIVGMIAEDDNLIERADLVTTDGEDINGPFPFRKGNDSDAFLTYISPGENMDIAREKWTKKIENSMRSLGWFNS